MEILETTEGFEIGFYRLVGEWPHKKPEWHCIAVADFVNDAVRLLVEHSATRRRKILVGDSFYNRRGEFLHKVKETTIDGWWCPSCWEAGIENRPSGDHDPYCRPCGELKGRLRR